MVTTIPINNDGQPMDYGILRMITDQLINFVNIHDAYTNHRWYSYSWFMNDSGYWWFRR